MCIPCSGLWTSTTSPTGAAASTTLSFGPSTESSETTAFPIPAATSRPQPRSSDSDPTLHQTRCTGPPGSSAVKIRPPSLASTIRTSMFNSLTTTVDNQSIKISFYFCKLSIKQSNGSLT
jgi:hypothetical protein